MSTVIKGSGSGQINLNDTTGSIQLNGSDVLTIDSSGNLTAPNNLTANTIIPTSSSAPTNGMFLPTTNTVGVSTNSTERMRIDSSGNVGIGTASPTSKLQVNGASLLGSPATFYVGDDGGSLGAFLNQTAALPIRFNTNGSERMRIDSSGNLLVGGTTVYGSCKTTIDSGSGNSLACRLTNTGASYVLWYYNSTITGSIGTNGTTTSYNTSSDYRLKENVAPMSGSIDRLKQLKPSTWSWVQDGSYGEGFIAHEAQTVVPEAVTGNKDAMLTEEYEVTPAVLDDDGNVVTESVMGTREVPNYQGIDQSKLVPLLTAALQEAITKIEDLETRIQTLESA